MVKILKIILLVVWIIVIFNFSLQDSTVSSNTSNSTLDTTLDVFVDVEDFKVENNVLYSNFKTYIRKTAHMIEFAILFVLANLIFKKYFYSFIFCVIIASIDETIQLFVSGRSGLLSDVFIDSIGISIGLIFVIIISLFNRRRKND